MQIATRFVLFASLAGLFTAAVAQGCGGNGSGVTTSGAGAGGHGGATTSGTESTTSGTQSTTSGTQSTTSGTQSTTSGTGGATTTSGTQSTTSGGTTTSGAATSSSTGGTACVPTPCQGHIYQCGDCIDNDGDGKIDSEDPDCLGPCDNTESSYYGGIPGQAGAACIVDCYFDQDSGSGNDDCYWNHKCDPHETAPNNYSPESWNGTKCSYDTNANTPGTNKTCSELYAMQSQACLDFCLPLTPNGCDCFGCCELPAGSGKFVWLGSEDGNGNGSCDLAHVDDPTKCEPCEVVPSCYNSCGHCEICIGKPTLPPDCFPPVCGNGVCDPGETCSNCPADCGMCPSTTSSSSSGSTTSSSSSSTTGSSSSSSSSSSTGSGGGTQCPAGVQACGLPGELPCPSGYYCVTGCCQKIPG
jgi:hypothetical protein